MNLIKYAAIFGMTIFLTLPGCFIQKGETETQNINDKLAEALRASDYAAAGMFIDQGADVNLMYEDESLLYFFTANGMTQLAIKAIERGADINWKKPGDFIHDNTALSLAIYNNDLILVKKIMEGNIDLEYKDMYGQTYFAKCLYLKRYECADLLLSFPKMKNCIKEDTNTWYYLIYYWSDNTKEIISKIYGDKVAVPEDVPVLMVAIDEDNLEAVRYFCDLGINKYKPYYDERSQEYITPYAKAHQVKYFLLHSPSSDFRLTEEDAEIIEINEIIDFLSS